MEVKGRVLAIDPGTKRIGYALSDDLQHLASPLEVWRRAGLDADLAHLRALVETHEVRELLVGVPYRLDGSESASTARALAFLEEVVAAFPELPVHTRDEGLTTWEAERRLEAQGVPPKKRKERVDAYAAAVLLEEELEARQQGSVPKL